MRFASIGDGGSIVCGRSSWRSVAIYTATTALNPGARDIGKWDAGKWLLSNYSNSSEGNANIGNGTLEYTRSTNATFNSQTVSLTDTNKLATRDRTLALGGSNTGANDPLKGNMPGEPATDDFDNDGISNLVEYALGLNPRISSVPVGTLTGNTLFFAKGIDAIANGEVKWIIETSETLQTDSWFDEVTQNERDPALTINYDFSPPTPAKKFARLKVVQIP